jgi:hypothetical protein
MTMVSFQVSIRVNYLEFAYSSSYICTYLHLALIYLRLMVK